MLYAAGLRQQGDTKAVRLGEGTAEDLEEYAGAATLFRRAAGVYEYVEASVLGSLDEVDAGCRYAMPFQKIDASG